MKVKVAENQFSIQPECLNLYAKNVPMRFPFARKNNRQGGVGSGAGGKEKAEMGSRETLEVEKGKLMMKIINSAQSKYSLLFVVMEKITTYDGESHLTTCATGFL